MNLSFNTANLVPPIYPFGSTVANIRARSLSGFFSQTISIEHPKNQMPLCSNTLIRRNFSVELVLSFPLFSGRPNNCVRAIVLCDVIDVSMRSSYSIYI